MEIEELTQIGRDDAAHRTYTSARQIEQAMMSYPALEDSISRTASASRWDPRNPQGRIRLAHNRYQETRYEEAGQLLPGLISDTEAASRAAGPDHPEFCTARAQVYDTTAALLSRVGEHSLAWTAADRAMWAAEQSGQPLTTAFSAYRLTYVLTGLKRPKQALDLAMTAVMALEQAMKSPSPQQLSVYGGLHLAAAPHVAYVDHDRCKSGCSHARSGPPGVGLMHAEPREARHVGPSAKS
jgi:hypothetical protein